MDLQVGFTESQRRPSRRFAERVDTRLFEISVTDGQNACINGGKEPRGKESWAERYWIEKSVSKRYGAGASRSLKSIGRLKGTSYEG